MAVQTLRRLKNLSMERNDINIEKKVLSSVLMQREDIDLFFERVNEKDFDNYITREIFKTVKELYMRGEKISPISVAKKSEGNADMLQEIAENYTLYGDFEEYLDELNKFKKRRELIEKAEKLREIAGKELDISQYQNRAEELIFENDDEKKEGIINLEDSLSDVYMKIIGEKENDYLPTGYPSLDAKVGGLIPGHLTVVAAPTSMGKTAFAINIAYNVLKSNKSVAFISLEMQHEEISERLLVQESKVPSDKYRKKLNKGDEKNIDRALSELMNKKMTISDTRGLDTTDIKARCRRIARQQEVDLIVVDYLQNIAINNEGVNYAKAVGLAVNDLRNLAKELDCPVMLISQVNRGREGVPRLKDLRDSGEIEENADEVWFPYRPEYDKDKAKTNPKKREDAKLILAKGRTTGVGAVDFVWYSEYLIWRDSYIDQTEGGLL